MNIRNSGTQAILYFDILQATKLANIRNTKGLFGAKMTNSFLISETQLVAEQKTIQNKKKPSKLNLILEAF